MPEPREYQGRAYHKGPEKHIGDSLNFSTWIVEMHLLVFDKILPCKKKCSFRLTFSKHKPAFLASQPHSKPSAATFPVCSGRKTNLLPMATMAVRSASLVFTSLLSHRLPSTLCFLVRWPSCSSSLLTASAHALHVPGMVFLCPACLGSWPGLPNEVRFPDRMFSWYQL